MRAFTLLELMAVIVLLALAASTLRPALGTHGDALSREGLISEVRDLDARARLIARRGGLAVLQFSPDHREWRLIDKRNGETVRTVRGARFGFVHPKDRSSIEFDLQGRCLDYTLRIRKDGRAFDLRVAGETGWITQTTPTTNRGILR